MHRTVFSNTAIIIILLLFHASCSNNDGYVVEDDLITVPIIVDDEDSRNFSEFVDTISFVPLETTSESMIGFINKLKLTDSRIYALDIRKRKSLFVFDNNGKYLYKIDKEGKGPGEYGEPTGFCINGKNEIIINDFGGKKILFYSSSGEFIREIHLGFYPGDIANLEGDLFVVTGYYPNFRINIIDGNGNIIRQEFKKDDRHSYAYSNEVFEGLERVYFRDYFEDTIYQVEKDRSIKKYLVDFQEKKLLKSDYLSIPLTIKNGITSRIIPDGLRYGCFNPIETSNFLSFYFWETPRRLNRYWCIYNKETGNSTYVNIYDEFDDLFGDRDPPALKAKHNDMFCFTLDSYELLGRYEKTIKNFSKSKPEALNQLKMICEGLTNSSNPILVKLSLDL